MIRKCLIFALVAGLIPSAASAEDDDFLSDAVVESEEEKKPKKPLFLIPLQPVWKTIEPAKIDDAVKKSKLKLRDQQKAPSWFYYCLAMVLYATKHGGKSDEQHSITCTVMLFVRVICQAVSNFVVRM